MNKYEIRTQKKKDAIMKASVELFREKGYTNVSINEIASISGVSSVSIYNYFGSKEGLLKESALLLMGETVDLVQDLLAKNGSFEDKLLEAVSICSEKPHQILEEYFSKVALEDEVFLELFNESSKGIRIHMLREFIEWGREEGAIDPSISTDTIMEYLCAISDIQSAWVSVNQMKEKSKELYKLMLYGLIGKQ